MGVIMQGVRSTLSKAMRSVWRSLIRECFMLCKLFPGAGQSFQG